MISQLACSAPAAEVSARWTEQKAAEWFERTPWLVGSNFAPAYAINQLEMWQADTFDAAAIDRELAWAEGLGFTSMRVFLHHMLWEQDARGFVKRMDEFLALADKHHVRIMFVLFDSVWDPHPKLGVQHAPTPGVHNSGWVQSPGADDLLNPARRQLLEAYVKGVVGHFKDDPRVAVWDVFNEPDNTNDNSYGVKNLKQEPPKKVELTIELLTQTFAWARSTGPTQPLTSGVWRDWGPGRSKMANLQLESSDVISFHSYDPLDGFKKQVEGLRSYKRPLLCTEYMARPRESTFESILPYLKEQKIAAYNWGFVSGKSQTIYPWDSWQKPYPSEPAIWFHDIFRADGTPFDEKEVTNIRSITKPAK